ncbi:MAG: hypothetical protein V7609_2680 [Verrucomicrobiota bacterium]
MPRTPVDIKPAKPPKSIARWVAGVVGVCSGAATIYGLFSNKRIIIPAFIGMIFAMVLLLVVQRAIRAVSAKDAKFYDLVVKIVIGFVVLYFIVLTAALFPFLLKWLTADSEQIQHSSATPSATQSSAEPSLARVTEACQSPAEQCTVFLFDYLNAQLAEDEFQGFQIIQVDRLNKGIRAHLASADLLKGIDFRVARCSATKIKETSVADRTIKAMKAPAIMWGVIQKLPDNKLVSTTFITWIDDQVRQIGGTRNELGVDLTQVLEIKGSVLAMASFIVGNVHMKAGKPEFARKAFLHAKELAVQVDEGDRLDFLTALNHRLQQLDAQNPVASLQPIGGGNP